MASHPKNLDKTFAILDLNEVVSKGQKTDNRLKDAFELLEIKLSNTRDKAVLILNEVIHY